MKDPYTVERMLGSCVRTYLPKESLDRGMLPTTGSFPAVLKAARFGPELERSRSRHFHFGLLALHSLQLDASLGHVG